jgi:hypothetical protein
MFRRARIFQDLCSIKPGGAKPRVLRCLSVLTVAVRSIGGMLAPMMLTVAGGSR